VLERWCFYKSNQVCWNRNTDCSLVKCGCPGSNNSIRSRKPKRYL